MIPRTKSAKPSVKSFLDTSAAYKLQVGHSAHKKYLSEAIPKDWYVNNYVKMEYYRSSLMLWVALYFECAEPFHRTFGDVLTYFSEAFGRVPKTVLQAVSGMLQSEGFSLVRPEDKEYCRQKLQDLIFEMALQFRETFRDMGKDPTKCARVPNHIRLPEAFERDVVLRRALVDFKAVKECRSRCKINHLFEREPYKKKMELISAIPAAGKAKVALERMREEIVKAQGKPDGITCRSCGTMGDAVIASLLDPAWKLHSMDSVHGPVSEAIGLEHQIHLSLRALNKASGAAAASNATPESRNLLRPE